MKCPNCTETLLMTERHTVEIDYCPNCRGVWLDKGELDKLLHFASPQRVGTMDSKTYRNNDYDGFENQNNKENYKGKPHKKKSFLSDFFDFD